MADDIPIPHTAAPTAPRKVRVRQSGPELEESRDRLLAAATEEFARFGLLGARVDVIARRANANKQLIYYHFGDKEGLYAAVLEGAYKDIRLREQELELGQFDPETAMRCLVEFTFGYVVDNPGFVSLVTDENVHQAVHLKHSQVLSQLRSPFVGLIEDTLKRGEATGVFRKGVDPAQFYISLAGLSFFYFTNIHTLSALFGRDLRASASVKRRRAHVLEFAMGYLRP